MKAPDGFVSDLRRYDSALRVRWGAASKKWLIERYLRPMHPQVWQEMPPEHSRKPLFADAWDGWREGYVTVLTVAPDLLHWNLVVQALAENDMGRLGGKDALLRKIEAAEAEWESAQQREIDTFVEAGTSESVERMAWLTGRRVAVPEQVSDGGSTEGA